MRGTKIAVLVPCLNEEKSITGVIKEYKEALPQAEIYVYDNGSTDRTALKALRAGAVVIKTDKKGKGNVVKEMFREVNADIYLMVDGDGTYPADRAAETLGKFTEENLDLLIGDRLSSGYYQENKSILHGIGNKTVNTLIKFLYGADMGDVMSGSRMMSRRFVKAFPAKTRGFETETEMALFAIHGGYKYASMPVPYRDRTEGKTKVKAVRDGIKIIWFILKDYARHTSKGIKRG